MMLYFETFKRTNYTFNKNIFVQFHIMISPNNNPLVDDDDSLKHYFSESGQTSTLQINSVNIFTFQPRVVRMSIWSNSDRFS